MSKHRLAALTRISSPKVSAIIHRSTPTPKYIAPRPRRIDTSEIDVSASRFANRRVSEVKIVPEPTKCETVEDVPNKGRTTIRRDRALVRLRTVRLASKSPEPKEKEEEVKVESVKVEEKPVDIDPGYGSSERSSGSWRNNFEGELDLYDKKVFSPTAKTPGENFFEKYHIKDSDDMSMHYLTIDDIPEERRESLRRRSAGRLPSFKEICSDISSDKLNDDLNAGVLRRRASLIIEEEINKIKLSASGTMLCTLEQQTSETQEETEGEKRKSRKVKKIRQKITAKTVMNNNHESPPIIAVIENMEIEETAFDVRPQQSVSVEDVENTTFKLPLRKKKKVTDVETKITCDSIVSLPGAGAEIDTNEKDDRKVHEAVVNIKAKKADRDSKILLDPAAVNEAAGEVKNLVKRKPSVKVEAPKMNPLRKDLSVDDFWGMIGTRETTNFAKRKQIVIEETKKTIDENSWWEKEENAERLSVLKDKNVSLKTSAENAPIELNSVVANKAESLSATSDKDKISANKSSSSDAKKPEKDASSAKAENESKPVAQKKVNEPKVEQKREENVTKINKSLDATKLDKDEKVGEKKKIGENTSPSEKQEEVKSFKLQPVPKPKHKTEETLVTSKSDEKLSSLKNSLDKKPELAPAPKTPPWKLQKKSEEKSPKSPPWRIKKPESPKEVFASSTKKDETVKIELKKETNDCDKVEAATAKVENPSKLAESEVKKAESPTTPTESSTQKVESPQKPAESLVKKVESPPKQTESLAKKEEFLPKLKESSLKLSESLAKNLESQTKPAEILAKKVDSSPKLSESLVKKAESPPKQTESLADKYEFLPKLTQSPPNPAEPIAKKVESQIKLTDSLANKAKSSSKLLAEKDANTVKFKPEVPQKTEEPVKKLSSKSKDKIPDTKLPSSAALKKKEETLSSNKSPSSNHKSKANTTFGTFTEADKFENSNKSPAPDQSTKTASDVNDQAQSKAGPKKKPTEGQKLETSETKVLNEPKNTQAQTAIDEAKLATSDSEKTFGKLSKFPTLNNLNSIAVNESSVDSQQSNNAVDNKTLAIDQTIASDPLPISVAIVSPVSTPVTKKEESESESDSEESSYEESSDEMEKKDFDPQKKVKLDFAQLRKCYGTDTKSNIKLVARPRPLWKIKRNRHAVFSESESSESSAEDETRSNAGDSASSSQSSTKSDKEKKKDGAKGDDNIIPLMTALNVNDGSDSESKKKNRLSTSSQDSGFCGLGATAARSPRKAMGKCEGRSAGFIIQFVLIIT